MLRRSFIKALCGGVFVYGLPYTALAAGDAKGTQESGSEVANTGKKSVTIIDTSYAALVDSIKKATLIPGARYRIVDFRTINDMDGKGILNSARPEVLIVTAVTANAVGTVAISETYPQDIIHYTVSNLHDNGRESESQTGRIIYREDSARSISAYLDWRGVKWRRWEESKGSRVFASVQDTGFAFADLYPFNNSPNADGCSMVKIGKYCVTDPHQTAHLRQNIIIGSGRILTMGNNCFNMTIGSNFYAVTIDDTNPDFVFGDFTSNIAVGKCSDNLRLGTGVGQVTVGSSCFNVTVGGNCHNIVIGDSNHDVVIPEGTRFFHLDHNIVGNDGPSVICKIASYTYTRKSKTCSNRVSGSFTTQDGRVATVTDGIVTAIEQKKRK